MERRAAIEERQRRFRMAADVVTDAWMTTTSSDLFQPVSESGI